MGVGLIQAIMPRSDTARPIAYVVILSGGIYHDCFRVATPAPMPSICPILGPEVFSEVRYGS